MRAQLDISDAEAATKIRSKYLRAMENEEFGLLPGPAFAKSFLRTYADYLGLDGRLLIDEYKLRHERPDELDMAPIGSGLGSQPKQKPPRPPRVSRAWVAGIAIVALLALFAYLGSSDEQRSDQDETKQAQQAEARRAAARERARKRRVAERARRRRALARRKIKLELVPTAGVFVCLENAEGEKLIDGEIILPGGEERIYRSRRFRMTLGNGSVELKVNGRSFDVPETDVSVGYELSRGGKRRELDEGERPSCE